MKARYFVCCCSEEDQLKAEGTYGAGYFPRGFAYKADAKRLVAELAEKGVEATTFPNMEKKLPRTYR